MKENAREPGAISRIGNSAIEMQIVISNGPGGVKRRAPDPLEREAKRLRPSWMYGGVLSIEDVSDPSLPATLRQAQSAGTLTPPYRHEHMDEGGNEGEDAHMDEDGHRHEDAHMDGVANEDEDIHMDDSDDSRESYQQAQNFLHLGCLADSEDNTNVASAFNPRDQVTQPTSDQISTLTTADFRALECQISVALPNWSKANKILDGTIKTEEDWCGFWAWKCEVIEITIPSAPLSGPRFNEGAL
jgi:hypothetical protein